MLTDKELHDQEKLKIFAAIEKDGGHIWGFQGAFTHRKFNPMEMEQDLVTRFDGYGMININDAKSVLFIPLVKRLSYKGCTGCDIKLYDKMVAWSAVLDIELCLVISIIEDQHHNGIYMMPLSKLTERLNASLDRNKMHNWWLSAFTKISPLEEKEDQPTLMPEPEKEAAPVTEMDLQNDPPEKVLGSFPDSLQAIRASFLDVVDRLERKEADILAREKELEQANK